MLKVKGKRKEFFLIAIAYPFEIQCWSNNKYNLEFDWRVVSELSIPLVAYFPA